MNNVKIGLVGCGLIADTHIEAILEVLDRPEIVVCDILPGKAEQLRLKYNLKASYSKIEEMLNQENPFCVHILTPPQCHTSHVLLSLEKGAHVFVEKPMALKSDDVEKMYRVAEKFGRHICVDYSLFTQPTIEKMLKEIKSYHGERIIQVDCFYGMDTDLLNPHSFPLTHWKNNLPGGLLIDSLVHPLSLAIYFTGKPDRIECFPFFVEKDMKELTVTWGGSNALGSITISTRAKPFRRITEVTTDRRTFLVDHSTESMVVLGPGFGPRSVRKLWKNIHHGVGILRGTMETVYNVILGRLKSNPGVRNFIKLWYQYLSEKAALPFTKEAVMNSAIAMDMIIERLGVYPQKSQEVAISLGQNIDIKNTATQTMPYICKKVLVTGAAGFLGRCICRELQARGHEVVAQVRRSVRTDQSGLTGIPLLYEDFGYEGVDYETLVSDVDVVVNCAAAYGGAPWSLYRKVNVDAALKLYQSARAAGCQSFIHMSSVAVYGMHHRNGTRIDEQDLLSKRHSKWDFYIRSKIMAEETLREDASRGGPSLLILRLGILYAKNGERLARRAYPSGENFVQVHFGNGRNKLPFTRVDEVARTIVRAIEQESIKEGIYNINGNSDENRREFVRNRLKVLGIECKFLGIPLPPFLALACILEAGYALIGGKKGPPVTRYLIRSDSRNVTYDTSRAVKDLGWDPEAAVSLT